MALVESMHLISDNADQIYYHVDYLTMECGQPTVSELLNWVKESGSLLKGDIVIVHDEDSEVHEYVWRGGKFLLKLQDNEE